MKSHANDGCNSSVYDSCMIGNSNAQQFCQLAWRFRQISYVYACCYPLNVGILRKDNTKTIKQNTQRHTTSECYGSVCITLAVPYPNVAIFMILMSPLFHFLSVRTQCRCNSNFVFLFPFLKNFTVCKTTETNRLTLGKYQVDTID